VPLEVIEDRHPSQHQKNLPPGLSGALRHCDGRAACDEGHRQYRLQYLRLGICRPKSSPVFLSSLGQYPKLIFDVSFDTQL
jgi:hypothetical protein